MSVAAQNIAAALAVPEIAAEAENNKSQDANAESDFAGLQHPPEAVQNKDTAAVQNGRRGKNDELLRKAKEGNRQAADELVQINLGLVRNIALRFRGRGTDYEDLVQIGTVGMLKAVKSFDFGYGTTFSTYAVPLIIGEIRRYLRDNGPIKISRSVKQNGMRLMREREAFTAEFGREPKISELAERCGMSADEASEALEACADICSLSAPAGDDGSLTLEGTLQDPDDRIASAADKIALGEALRTLPALRREIIFLRYYKNMSQQQTGEKLGISQVKVSREEKKILEQLRAVL